MLTKAYISEVISSHTIRVRVPLYNKIEGVNGATPKNELAIACVCSLPNFVTAPQVGDIVIVGFEEDDISKPVILGYLSRNAAQSSITDIRCNKLVALDDVILDAHTTIGDIKPENIECLKNLRDNIKQTFDTTKTTIDNINSNIDNLDKSMEVGDIDSYGI